MAHSVKEAEAMFNSGDYERAYDEYEYLMNNNSRDYTLKFKAARCLVLLKRYNEAIPLFDLCLKKKMYKSYYYLYESYFALYQFDEAANAIKQYMNEVELDNEAKAISMQCLTLANEAKRMLEATDGLVVVDSVRVPKNDILSAYPLSSAFGKLYYTENDSIVQTIGYETGRGDKRIETRVVDERKVLMLAHKLVDKWSETLCLSKKLNQYTNCNYPYEMPDGITLYFASNEPTVSLGGYDIFMSRISQGEKDYTAPLNIGMPYNSPANDYLYVVDDIDNRGWFATDRRQHPDSVMIYEFIPDKVQKLSDTIVGEQRCQIAQLFEYEIANIADVFNKDVSSSYDDGNKGETINFVVSDNVIYRFVDEFMSNEAKEQFEVYQLLLKAKTTNERLLDGKRREFDVSFDEKDRTTLRAEIVAIEEKMFEQEAEIKSLVRKIRVLELEALNN